MRKKSLLLLILITMLCFIATCYAQQSEEKSILLHQFPIDNMEGIIAQPGVQIDKEISNDGNGSLQIVATEPITVELFEVDISDIILENSSLVYQAFVRTENVDGQVYLEMWVHFPGKGEFFSRDLQTPLTGTTDWSQERTPFNIERGENPDYVKLNLVIDGTGTVWIDNIGLLKEPFIPNPGSMIGIIGGAIGAIIGVIGGLIGTYFSIRNTKGPNAKKFMIKMVIIGWIGITIFIMLILYLPQPYNWLLWIPYGVLLPIWIIYGNKKLHKIEGKT